MRDKFFNAMRRTDSSFIPFEFSLCPSKQDEFEKKTGNRNYVEYYKFPVRGVYANYTGSKEKYKKYFTSGETIDISDWGVGHVQGSLAHFTKMRHPMENFESIDEFMAYPFPDPENDYDWESLRQKVPQVQNKDLIAVAHMEMTIFETAWYLRGMDNFMIDMATNPEPANFLMEKITEIKCVFAKKYAEAGCDVLRLGDDVSTQLDMMMNPEMWREFLKPRLARVIKAAKEIKPDILIFYHGDGNLQKIIPDLIEIGVEILNPIQPECMNPVELKEKFGDKLSFWGTLGTQSTLPFGTPDEVRDACRNMIENVGKGGGLFLCPSHMIEPEVPLENIQAFIDEVCAYNERNS